ncbi:hypothetical protein ACMHYB_23925 [Sorangium sp. So ce1128]
MKRTAPPGRRALLFALSVMALGAPCCAGGDWAPSSTVEGLRIVAVTADRPYAAPGEDVTLRMTYADAPGEASDGSRPVEITWLGGCVNPPAGVDEHLGCLPQWLGVYLTLPPGATEREGLFLKDALTAEQSAAQNGAPDARQFTLKVPSDILKSAEPTETGTVFSTAFVLFTACAGTTRPAAEPEKAGFPLECVDGDGRALGADSFVVGYTQIYVFGDRRPNQPPPVSGLTLDETVIEEGEEKAPTVARCVGPEGNEEPQGCSPREPGDGCKTYEIEALVDDVAEEDVESGGLGALVREAIWVDYYADKGEFDGTRSLVSDTVTGYREDHAVTWIPPSEPGLVSLWAVVHDSRGGVSVTRRFVRVE